jgi:predicted nucleic acid-binding protein
VLIVDTGVLLAAADANDPDHATCAALLLGESGDLVTTALVIAETAYLIGRQLGASAEAAFFVSVAERSVVVDELTADDLRRIAALVADYRSSSRWHRCQRDRGRGAHRPSGTPGVDVGFVSWAGCLPEQVVVLTNGLGDDIGNDDVDGMARPLVDALKSH